MVFKKHNPTANAILLSPDALQKQYG